MLIADQARRRCTYVPVGLLALGLGLAALTVGMASTVGGREPWVVGGLALLLLGWFAYGVRHARREGDELEVRSLVGTQRVPAKGSEVELQQGGGHRSPHLDVLLRAPGREALRLARLELLGLGRAPRLARRIAAVLDVPVHERSVGALETQLDAAAEQRRTGWRWLAGIVAVGAIVSFVMPLFADRTMASIEIRCPGGRVKEGNADMHHGLEMTVAPGVYEFELHPRNEPPWTQRVELVAGQTTVLDCSVRPGPTKATQARDRQ